ncbi:MAG: WG repeat-containing protein [Oscillospiraceae bacterium]|nr:WG repeat-containing protein [Oscillospiraceae bacterium]
MRKLSVLMILLMLTTMLFACTGANRGTSPDPDPEPESEEEIFYSEQESSSVKSQNLNAEKVAGTHDLYWHTKPTYDYDNMQAIGWSGLWMIEKDGKHGAIDANGNVKIPIEYEYSDYCSVCKGHSFYIIPGSDSKNAFVTYDGGIEYNKGIHTAHGGATEYFWDIEKNKGGSSGHYSINDYHSFEEETVVVSAENSEKGDDGFLYYTRSDNVKYGISKGDKLLVPLEYDYIIENFKKYEYYDYKEFYTDEYGAQNPVLQKRNYSPQEIYSAKKDGKAGFIKGNGVIVIPFIFEETDNFNNEIAAVKQESKWGFVFLEAASLDELSSDPESEEESSEDISEAESVIIDTSSDTVETDKSKTSRSKSSKKSKKSKQSETPVKVDKPVKPVKIGKDDFLQMKMPQIDYMPEGTAIPFKRASLGYSFCHNECNPVLNLEVEYDRAARVSILKTFKGLLYKEGFLGLYSFNCKKQKNKKAVSPFVWYMKFRDNNEREMTENEVKAYPENEFREYPYERKNLKEVHFEKYANIILNVSEAVPEYKYVNVSFYVNSMVRKGNELYIGITSLLPDDGMFASREILSPLYSMEVKKSDIEGITKIYSFTEKEYYKN